MCSRDLSHLLRALGFSKSRREFRRSTEITWRLLPHELLNSRIREEPRCTNIRVHTVRCVVRHREAIGYVNLHNAREAHASPQGRFVVILRGKNNAYVLKTLRDTTTFLFNQTLAPVCTAISRLGSPRNRFDGPICRAWFGLLLTTPFYDLPTKEIRYMTRILRLIKT